MPYRNLTRKEQFHFLLISFRTLFPLEFSGLLFFFLVLPGICIPKDPKLLLHPTNAYYSFKSYLDFPDIMHWTGQESG